MKRMGKKSLFLLSVIIILGAALRLYQLGEVPHGVTHDELGYIYNAYAIAKTGRNIFGQSLPLFSFLSGGGFAFMPVPTYLVAALFTFLPLSAFTGRLLNTILGTGSIILVFLLVRKLFRNDTMALFSAFALALSPWHVFFSRTAYDPLVASFFYLSAVTAWVTAGSFSRRLGATAILLGLGLFSYRGATPMMLGLPILMLWWGIGIQKITRRQAMVTVMAMAVPIVLFLGAVSAYKNRGFVAEAMPDTKKIQWEMELMMRESQGPHGLKRVFLNRPTLLASQWVRNYLEGYAPGHLFLYGESSQIYSMWMRGKLYLVDIVLLMLGFMYLLRLKSLAPSALVLGLVAISGFPGMVGAAPYASRNFFMTVPAAIVSGCGLYVLTNIKKWRRTFVIVLIVVYTFSVSHFLFDYFFRYAYQRAEPWAKSLKDIAKILEENEKKNRRTLVASWAFGDMLQYAFYAGIAPDTIQASWSTQTSEPTPQYALGRGIFVSQCPEKHLLSLMAKESFDTVMIRAGCLETDVVSRAVKDYYGNTIWSVYDASGSKSIIKAKEEETRR